jgi:uncharacterized delta-60 repeat protein
LPFFIFNGFTQSLIPDSTFSNDGIIIHPIGSINDEIRAITIQPDGKIIGVGMSYTSSPAFICGLSRYLPDGNLDTSFAGSGFFTDSYGQLSCAWHAVALQNDSMIVVAGTARDTVSLTDNFAVGRYHTDGSVDSSFGTNGKLMTDFFGSNDLCRSMVIQNDGKIVAAGTTGDSLSNFYMAAIRYNTDGSPDTSFSNDGNTIVDFGLKASCTAMLIQPDGKIILCGAVTITNTIFNLAFARINTNGTIDSTFGSNGKQVFTTSYSFTPYSAALQNDGKIIASGSATVISPYEHFAIARILPAGLPDTTFSNDGIATTLLGSFNDLGRSLTLQNDGKIIVGGSTSTGLQSDMAMVRYNTDGTLDNSFGSGGKFIFPTSTSFEMIYTLQFQPDGKLIAGGFSQQNNQRQFAVLRFMDDLSIGVLEFSDVKNNLLIYPNPVGNHINLKYELKSDELVSINLMDLQGRIIQSFYKGQWQSSGVYDLTLDFSTISSGSYLLQISNNSSYKTVRIIKN